MRNRERLLKAAADIFSTGGPNASLEAVARKAGVGIGTLYRHFPTREALFQAVYKREVDELVALADDLRDAAVPIGAVRIWLRANVHMVATKKGMLAALVPTVDGSADLYVNSRTRLLQSLEHLMARAVSAGELRADITVQDVMQAIIGICYASQQPGWQETVTHLLDVFVDGLSAVPNNARSDHPLPLQRPDKAGQ